MVFQQQKKKERSKRYFMIFPPPGISMLYMFLLNLILLSICFFIYLFTFMLLFFFHFFFLFSRLASLLFCDYIITLSHVIRTSIFSKQQCIKKIATTSTRNKLKCGRNWLWEQSLISMEEIDENKLSLYIFIYFFL
jgi:hypothetical protein